MISSVFIFRCVFKIFCEDDVGYFVGDIDNAWGFGLDDGDILFWGCFFSWV